MTKNVSTTVVQPHWLSTADGDIILRQLCVTGTAKKKSFGILEKPNIQGAFEEISYKLFFIGKSSTEKAKTIYELASNSKFHLDSNGIQKTNIYWPTKVWDKIILFRLQCWEAGDSGLKKFSHILPACIEKVDALIFMFSFEDKNSLLETSQNITKLKGSESSQPAIIVIGTKFSTNTNASVSFSDVREFEMKWHLNVIRLPSFVDNLRSINRSSPILNFICEQLWIRDQEYIMRQSLDKFAFKK